MSLNLDGAAIPKIINEYSCISFFLLFHKQLAPKHLPLLKIGNTIGMFPNISF